jgi:putrescine transport system permease protein
LTAFQVDQAVTIWIAHTTFCAAYVAVVVSARLRELDLSIEEAAADGWQQPDKRRAPAPV